MSECFLQRERESDNKRDRKIVTILRERERERERVYRVLLHEFGVTAPNLNLFRITHYQLKKIA